MEKLSKHDSTDIVELPQMVDDKETKEHERFPKETISAVATDMYTSLLDSSKQLALPVGRQKAVKLLDVNEQSELRLYKCIRMAEFQNFLIKQGASIKDQLTYVNFVSSIVNELPPQQQRLL